MERRREELGMAWQARRGRELCPNPVCIMPIEYSRLASAAGGFCADCGADCPLQYHIGWLGKISPENEKNRRASGDTRQQERLKGRVGVGEQGKLAQWGCFLCFLQWLLFRLRTTMRTMAATTITASIAHSSR